MLSTLPTDKGSTFCPKFKKKYSCFECVTLLASLSLFPLLNLYAF